MRTDSDNQLWGCKVAQILLELCASGREAVAADLLAALANGRGCLPFACNTVVLLVRQVKYFYCFLYQPWFYKD